MSFGNMEGGVPSPEQPKLEEVEAPNLEGEKQELNVVEKEEIIDEQMIVVAGMNLVCQVVRRSEIRVQAGGQLTIEQGMKNSKVIIEDGADLDFPGLSVENDIIEGADPIEGSKCPKCGYSMRPAANFCSKCGDRQNIDHAFAIGESSDGSAVAENGLDANQNIEVVDDETSIVESGDISGSRVIVSAGEHLKFGRVEDARIVVLPGAEVTITDLINSKLVVEEGGKYILLGKTENSKIVDVSALAA